MRPIPNTDNYFWVGEGAPTATNSVPVGATYFNQTAGSSHRFTGNGGWVAIPDSLTDISVTAAAISDASANAVSLITAADYSAMLVLLKKQLTTAGAIGAGTVYSLTNTAAAVVLGTTSPVATLTLAGRWFILAKVLLAYTGATVVTETATLKLRRTNNTATDITGSSIVIDLPVATTLTHTYGIIQLPSVVVTTANLDDSITIFGNISATLGAGTIDAGAGSSILALYLGT